jgi:hypothetical protein
MMVATLRLTLISLIVGNNFKFTTLVRMSADTIRIVYEMRPCADILPGASRMTFGWHPVNTAAHHGKPTILRCTHEVTYYSCNSNRRYILLQEYMILQS